MAIAFDADKYFPAINAPFDSRFPLSITRAS
jgi:hypothetical protein